MKQRYIVKGTMRLGEFVRLFLSKEDVAKPSEKIGMLEMMSNSKKIIEEQQIKAVLTQQPDVITISYEEWKKHQYKVDDIVWIDVREE